VFDNIFTKRFWRTVKYERCISGIAEILKRRRKVWLSTLKKANFGLEKREYLKVP